MSNSTSLAGPTGSRLLAIPVAIRHRISELVLCEEGYIDITPSDFQQPALLRTCRQIRHESSGIYCHRNRFYLHCPDFSGSGVATFFKQAGMYANASVNTFPYLLPGPGPPESWQSLKSWVRQYWMGRAYGMKVDVEHGKAHNLAAAAFGIAASPALRTARWEEVEEILEFYKIGTGDSIL